MVLTIAKREFRSMFLSPLAWVLLAIIQLILSLFFFDYVYYFFENQSDPTFTRNTFGVTHFITAQLFDVASKILLMITPLLTMRLISEEKHNHTISLLLSAPVSITEIVLGKYLGLLFFMLIILFLITLMPLSLSMGTELGILELLSSIFGLFLMLAMFGAIGLYMSSLADNPMIAAISTFGALLLLWVFGLFITTTEDDANVLNYLSFQVHFMTILRGILNTKDIAYFLLFITGFIVLTIRQLETQRLQS